MTDTPERIWAWQYREDGGVYKFWISNPDKIDGEETEYVRKDVADAAVEEERERCARIVLAGKFYGTTETLIAAIRKGGTG